MAEVDVGALLTLISVPHFAPPAPPPNLCRQQRGWYKMPPLSLQLRQELALLPW